MNCLNEMIRSFRLQMSHEQLYCKTPEYGPDDFVLLVLMLTHRRLTLKHQFWLDFKDSHYFHPPLQLLQQLVIINLCAETRGAPTADCCYHGDVLYRKRSSTLHSSSLLCDFAVSGVSLQLLTDEVTFWCQLRLVKTSDSEKTYCCWQSHWKLYCSCCGNDSKAACRGRYLCKVFPEDTETSSSQRAQGTKSSATCCSLHRAACCCSYRIKYNEKHEPAESSLITTAARFKYTTCRDSFIIIFLHFFIRAASLSFSARLQTTKTTLWDISQSTITCVCVCVCVCVWLWFQCENKTPASR